MFNYYFSDITLLYIVCFTGLVLMHWTNADKAGNKRKGRRREQMITEFHFRVNCSFKSD